jgi:hypothetical protein
VAPRPDREGRAGAVKMRSKPSHWAKTSVPACVKLKCSGGRALAALLCQIKAAVHQDDVIRSNDPAPVAVAA